MMGMGSGMTPETTMASEILSLDEKAKEALANISDWQQKAVIEDINPDACRNPSAVVIKKITEMRRGKGEIKQKGNIGMMGMGSGMTPETTMASEILSLDEKAKEALANISDWQQKAVIEDINPDACRNPSAVVIKKITEMRRGKGE